MPLHTHYDNLKVARNAPPEVIRAAYRVLAQRYHPDLHPSPEAERIMTVINEAYAVLSDPQRRAAHDTWIDDQLSKESLAEPVAGAGRQKPNRYPPPPRTADRRSEHPPQPSPRSESSASSMKGGVRRGTKLGILAVISGAFVAWLWTSVPSPGTYSPGQPASGTTPRVTAVEQTSNGNLLRLICDVHNIKGNTCSEAKGYPEKSLPDRAGCSVELKEWRAEGHYLSADSTILLVVYESECEPHAMNWGGALLFEKRGASLVFKGYQRGLAVTDCTSISEKPGHERLLCLGGFFGQGYLESTLLEVVFTQNIERKVDTSITILVTATDSTGARGANVVDCEATFSLFEVSSPEPGPAPNTILVQARYADADRIRKACTPDRKPPKDVTVYPGEGYIDEHEIREAQFTIDLATRKLTKVSAAQPMRQ